MESVVTPVIGELKTEFMKVVGGSEQFTKARQVLCFSDLTRYLKDFTQDPKRFEVIKNVSVKKDDVHLTIELRDPVSMGNALIGHDRVSLDDVYFIKLEDMVNARGMILYYHKGKTDVWLHHYRATANYEIEGVFLDEALRLLYHSYVIEQSEAPA